MSNNNENKLVPKLRFPEFQNIEGWKEKQLGAVGEFIGGGTPDTSVQEYWDGEIQWFTPTEIKEKNIKRSLRTITQKGLQNSSAKLLPKGALLITTRATIGDVGIAIEECTTNQGFQSLVVNDTENNLFWYYWLTQHKSELKRKSSGSTFPEIGKNEIIKITAYSPKKPEQQKIASCLSSLDEVITAESQKLDILQDHKKGLLQNLMPQEGESVPKFRFKEFEDSGEWMEKSFEELLEIGNGRDYKHLDKGNIPVYGSGGYMLSVNDFLYDGESVCIGRKGTIDKPMFLTGKFWTVDTLFYTHSFKDCLPKFIFYIFQNINWLKHNEAGGVPSLSKTNIYKIYVHVPEPNEQEKIADTLSSIDELINAQNLKVDALKLNKKGLLQGLFPDLNTVNE